MWEDERNKRGGRWLITLNKQQRKYDLDRFWLETVRVSKLSLNTPSAYIHALVMHVPVLPHPCNVCLCPCPQLLCLIGEAFDDYSDEVCGAVVNVRTKGDKIAVWTSDYENREAITHIG